LIMTPNSMRDIPKDEGGENKWEDHRV
jgi:hypothetical protein